MNGHPSIGRRASNPPILTVSELAVNLKRLIEAEFDLVRVRGEITGFKRAASGHLYFSLKDTEACLDSVCWRTTALRLAVEAADGLDVIALGRLTTYPDRSKYQLIVDSLELAGEGALLKLLEERKRRLAAEGLFEAARKRALPFLPEVIGVVTSPSGAVIRDILHRLADRFPRRVLLWPVLVQGPEAPAQIAAAIDGFNRLPAGSRGVARPDVLIVARGGGSLEDLWAFNEEVVVRAIAASMIPVISAVGHETDVTLADFAADLRAPTPTAAAEMAVPVRLELASRLQEARMRLTGAVRRFHDERKGRLLAGARGLPRPQTLLALARQRLDDRSERLHRGVRSVLADRRQRLARIGSRLATPASRIAQSRKLLESERRALESALRENLSRHRNALRHVTTLLQGCSYQQALERGFALVRDAAGRVITRAKALRPGQRVSLLFVDGTTEATIARGRPAAGASRSSEGEQGDLF